MTARIQYSRRQLLQMGALSAGLGLLQGCRTMVDQSLPTPVAAGSSLYFTACSGPLPDARQKQQAVERLRLAGYQLENVQALDRRYQRFAGSDAQRLGDLNQLISRRRAPQLLVAGRGGYGATRLLPHIDYGRLCPLLRESGSQLIGYSDFTAIQLALLAKGGLGSFAGPMVSDFGAKQLSAFTLNEFLTTTTTPNRQLRVDTPQRHNASGEGIFWGGNLSVLSSLVGTPYLPEIKGGLLFLEDVAEQPYRIERMLQQLHLAGVLAKQRAIFIGDFNMNRQVDIYDPGYTLDAVLEEIRRLTGVPVLTGIPFGHVHDKTTLPLGFPARFSADGGGLTLQFFDYPVTPANPQQKELLSTASPL
ncbi:LD-carboxypeptidase [Chromobacterium haemolyticum]|uniref:LD-carboxypeptidase n=2 Tax=Chromobacterium haemolyticum TaxID=394935 RepID=A0A1W0D864_9NEIS|nr:LD-carboxypeptidase [Chromobacterium haemolyticum]